MATNPPVIVVEIVGMLMGDRGHSCEEHVIAALCWRRKWLCIFGRYRFWLKVTRRLQSLAIG